MTCPSCGLDFEPTVSIHGLTVCANGHSLVLATGQRATAADTLILTSDEIAQLRAARQRPKRAEV